MAIDVVKYLADDEVFAWKYPSDDLKLGTQVVVNTAQVAFFVKGGVILDMLTPGTHTLSPGNIPLLHKLINIPFGGESPFKAEIWYVNLINKLDCKWGTTTPIQLEDAKYGIIVPIRAYGQYGFKIGDPRIFLEKLVGNMSSYTAEKVTEYFKGKIISSLTSLISQKMTMENLSVLEINAQLDKLSSYCQKALDLTDFGIQIVNFYFMSINIPEDDESLKHLKEAKDLAAKIKIMGKDIYQMDRTFDVLDKASQNEGLPGGFVGAGVGMGVGVNIGNQMAQMSKTIDTNPQASPTPPPPPGMEPALSFFLFENKQQTGPFPMERLKSMATEGKLTRSTYVWRQGMEKWELLENVSELNTITNLIPPTPPSV